MSDDGTPADGYRETTGRWDCWESAGGSREITAHRIGGAGERNQRLEVTETADAVSLLLRLEKFTGRVPAVGKTTQHSAELAAPVGERLVIDGCDGEPRPYGTHIG